ncbi:MAG: hypothetical protein FWE82_00070 [Defluviitaleaceae bacterium]|nr:hypothetical protein [Defluviitaleaceae bacterium]
MKKACKKAKDFFSEESAKLKPMTFKEKAEYIWEYYKSVMIVIVLAAVFVGYTVNIFVNPPRRQYILIAWTGEFQPGPKFNEFANLLARPIDMDHTKETVAIETFFTGGTRQYDITVGNQFTAMVRSGDVDIVVVNESDLVALHESGFLIDLADVFPDAQLQYTFGVPIAESPAAMASGIEPNNQYAAILVGGKRHERAIEVMLLMYTELDE